MSYLRHYFSLFRVRQRCKMLQKDFVIVLCLIGLLQSPLSVGAEPQLGVPFPDGKPDFSLFIKECLKPMQNSVFCKISCNSICKSEFP